MKNTIIFQVITLIVAFVTMGCMNVTKNESQNYISTPVKLSSPTLDPNDSFEVDMATANAEDEIRRTQFPQDASNRLATREAYASPTPSRMERGIFKPGHRYVTGLNPKFLDVMSAWVGDVDDRVMFVRVGAYKADENLDGMPEKNGLGGVLYEGYEDGLVITESEVGGLVIESFDEEREKLILVAENESVFEFDIRTFELIPK